CKDTKTFLMSNILFGFKKDGISAKLVTNVIYLILKDLYLQLFPLKYFNSRVFRDIKEFLDTNGYSPSERKNVEHTNEKTLKGLLNKQTL
ncbi:MAG: hypothetical protein ACOYMD_14620, partial [Paludibacter sp.]